MVFYHTSANVKVLYNILLEYAATKDITPDEFMKGYVEKCPVDTDDNKLSWFIESFLGIHKHSKMLQEVSYRIYKDDFEKDRDYFVIIFYAITFQITPTHAKSLLKCMLNLSQSLLDNVLKFFCSNETLMYISQVAQKYYDMKYVTEKIINPLFTWQPHITEMTEYYSDYQKKIEQRKFRPLTIPIQPLVLSRKSKKVSVTPAPTLKSSSCQLHYKPKKMLSKSTIDAKLEQEFERNKQKAANLLADARSNQAHYALPKIDTKNLKTIESKELPQECSIKTHFLPVNMKFINNIKDTTSTIKRVESTAQRYEREEIEWLDMIIKNCNNISKVDELEKLGRQEQERERLIDIERKHLMGQLSFEEAVLAKKKLADKNKKRYEEFLKDKAKWLEELENYRKEETERNRKHVERCIMDELSLLEAKNELALKNRQKGKNNKRDKEAIIAHILKTKKEELDRKINMIKEIKILSIIAKEARAPKTIDLTETAGYRFLCEMSMAELEERLVAMKISLNDELEKKREIILKRKESAKQALIIAKNNVQTFLQDRNFSRVKQRNEKPPPFKPPKELCDLKKLLEEKRKLRIELSNK